MEHILKLFFKKPLLRLSAIFLFFFIFLPSTHLKAQGDKKQPRILIVLDESSSMILPWVHDKLRYAAAKELILAIMDSVYSVNGKVEFALRAFGEQNNVRENNCVDSKLEVMFSQNNKTQMSLRLDDLHPLGVTPIAYSLKEAAENDMDDQILYYYGLILITDGEESCGGNLCDVMKSFVNNKINYKPYIINLSSDGSLKMIYDCMGNYLQANTQADIAKTAGIIKERFKPDLTKIVKKEPVVKEDYKVLVVIPGVVVYKPSPIIIDSKQLQLRRVGPVEPEEDKLRFKTPAAVVFKPEVNIPPVKLQQIKRLQPDEVERERTRLSTPDVAVYKPELSIPKITLQQVKRIQPDEVERERTRLSTPEVAVYKPELKIPAVELQQAKRIQPDEVERERTRLSTPEVTIYKPEINIPAIQLQKVQVAIAEAASDKLRFAIPDVSVLVLPPFALGKVRKNDKRLAIDTLEFQVRLNTPYGVCVDSKGNIYISDNENNRIRKVDTKGIITTIAGTGEEGYERDGVPAISTKLFKPCGILVDEDDNIYFSDRHNRRIRKIDNKGIITTFAGTGVQGYNGDTGTALHTQFFTPSYLTRDAAGDMFLSDSGRVWKIGADGRMKVIAGDGHAFSSLDADNGYVRVVGDNGPAKKASLNRPRGIAVDKQGNLYIVDRGHFRIRKVDATGKITTAAGTGEYGFQGDGAHAKLAKMSDMNDATLDKDGNLYFTDGNMVRRLNKEGIINIIAGTGRAGYSGDGGPATDARLWNPASIALDKEGNLYIAEAWNNVIRKVDTKGIITTVAGCGKAGFMGDGLPAATGAPQK